MQKLRRVIKLKVFFIDGSVIDVCEVRNMAEALELTANYIKSGFVTDDDNGEMFWHSPYQINYIKTETKEVENAPEA